MNKEQIAIIDFGSQYTHLITRRIRQLGVLARIYTPDVRAVQLKGVKGLILSGGPKSVHDRTAIKYSRKLFDLSVPILGLCYGHQLIAQHFGGQVKPGKTKEYGYANLKLTSKTKLFSGVADESRVWMSHGDSVKALPKGFIATASTTDCPVAAMADENRNLYGLQFHPEVTHSHAGLQVLSNFIFDVCRCKKDWSLDKYWRQIVADVKKRVGKRNVFLLVSGGVDSTVCFALLEKILGKRRVFGLHVDNGFMRLDESEKVAKQLAAAGFGNLYVVDASEQFLHAVRGIAEPERKREKIGATFLRVKDRVMAEQKFSPKQWMLGQGTIYPDTIETGGTKHADKIKTHHNRVKEILKMMKLGTIIEPIVELYKDEVRAVGKKIGLPAPLLDRHPFPGPGLSIRVLCSTGQETIENKNQINKDLQRLAGAAFYAAVLPVKSVGVQGDNRTYRHPAVLTGALDPFDGAKRRSGSTLNNVERVDWQKLHDVAVRITNEVRAVNRVVYAVYPSRFDVNAMKLKEVYLTKDRLDLLRRVDDIVTQEIKAMKLYNDIWQFPVALAPLTVRGGETVILRPVESKEAMTVNFFAMPKAKLARLVKKIAAVSGVDAVLYDITNKPPGTIEWE